MTGAIITVVCITIFGFWKKRSEDTPKEFKWYTEKKDALDEDYNNLNKQVEKLDEMMILGKNYLPLMEIYASNAERVYDQAVHLIEVFPDTKVEAMLRIRKEVLAIAKKTKEAYELTNALMETKKDLEEIKKKINP